MLFKFKTWFDRFIGKRVPLIKNYHLTAEERRRKAYEKMLRKKEEMEHKQHLINLRNSLLREPIFIKGFNLGCLKGFKNGPILHRKQDLSFVGNFD
jgi:hypothetical protein